MPEISRFYGIIISIFFNDHNPPHFHARYGEYKAAIGISNLEIRDGYLPPRTMGLVIEWALIHKNDLFKNWQAVKHGRKLIPIKPLI